MGAGITAILWLARSPDCNPIENMWVILSRKVYENGRQYDSLDDLKEAIIYAWDQISLETVKHLISLFPKRLVKVIGAKGGPSGY